VTGNDVIEQVNRLLLGGSREEINQLQVITAANATTLILKHPLGGIRAGAEVDVDLETYRVWSVDTGANTATVQPGMNGTVSSLHAADSFVYVNPRLSRVAIFQAINDELRALSSPASGLFQMKTIELILDGATTDYDLASDVLDVYEARLSVPGPSNAWERLGFRWNGSADSSFFPSGNSIHLIGTWPGRETQILYKAPFTPITLTSQDLNTQSGMDPSMQDIVVLGVLLRLGPVREIKRSFTEAQGDSRRAEEVASGNVQNSFASVRQLYHDRITAEALRLSQKYPTHHR
jgi:hypothetical protein